MVEKEHGKNNTTERKGFYKRSRKSLTKGNCLNAKRTRRGGIQGQGSREHAENVPEKNGYPCRTPKRNIHDNIELSEAETKEKKEKKKTPNSIKLLGVERAQKLKLVEGAKVKKKKGKGGANPGGGKKKKNSKTNVAKRGHPKNAQRKKAWEGNEIVQRKKKLIKVIRGGWTKNAKQRMSDRPDLGGRAVRTLGQGKMPSRTGGFS